MHRDGRARRLPARGGGVWSRLTRRGDACRADNGNSCVHRIPFFIGGRKGEIDSICLSGWPVRCQICGQAAIADALETPSLVRSPTEFAVVRLRGVASWCLLRVVVLYLGNPGFGAAWRHSPGQRVLPAALSRRCRGRPVVIRPRPVVVTILSKYCRRTVGFRAAHCRGGPDRNLTVR